MLVSQEKPFIEHYLRRSEFEQWVLTSIDASEGQLVLPTLDVSLPVAEVYARVDFAKVAMQHSPEE